MKLKVEYLGYAGLLSIVAAGLVRLLFLDSGPVALVLLIAGVVLFLVYSFRSGVSVQRFLTRRSTREGGNVFFTGIFVLGIVVLVNLIVSRLDLQRDVTADRVFTLAPETVAALEATPSPPKVWIFHPPATPEADAVRWIMEAAERVDPELEFRVLDPWQEPVQAGRFDLRQYATVVEIGDEFQTFTGVSEEEFTTAVIRASRGARLRIGLLRDHGEPLVTDAGPEGLRAAAGAMDRRGMDVVYRSLIKGDTLPDTLGALVIAGPQTEFSQTETEAVTGYLRNGGRVLVLLDPASPVTLDPVLALGGVRFRPQFVRDPDGRDPLVHLPRFSGHPVVRSLAQRRIQVVLSGAGALELPPSREGMTKDQLLWSGPRAVFAGDPDTVEAKSKIFAAASRLSVGNGREARLVVIADRDFVLNRSWETLGNADLFLGALAWLAEREEVSDIRPRARTNRPVVLTNQQGRALWVLIVLLLPVLILSSGFAVWWKRR